MTNRTSRVLTTPAALDAAPADQFLLSTRKVKVCVPSNGLIRRLYSTHLSLFGILTWRAGVVHQVSGSVRDEVGSPIAGAVVAVTHGDFTVKTVTDAKG
jgi:hypothetical protein